MKQENAYQWGKVQMKKDMASVYFIPYITGFSYCAYASSFGSWTQHPAMQWMCCSVLKD